MNDLQTRSYDPKQVIMTFGGITVTGYISGTFIEVEKEDGFKEDVGADGTENRTNTNKTGANLKVSIQQQSLTNDQFSAVHEADIKSNTGKAPLTIKDGNGTTLVYSKQAYIKNYAKINYGESATGREWNFRLPNVGILVGGNLV